MSQEHARVEKLNDTNYETWKIQVQSALQLKRLWKYVKCELKGVENEEGNEDALAYMRLSVCPPQLRHLKDAATAHEGWEKVKKVHKKAGPAYEMQLFRKLNEKCEDVGKIAVHVEKFLAAADEIRSCGAEIGESVLGYMLLNGLPKSFEYFEVAMTTREKAPSLSELKNKIEDEIHRQNLAPKTASLEVKAEEDSVPVEAENNVWLARNRNWKGENRNYNCYNCLKPGHFARDCREKIKRSLLATGSGVKTSKEQWVVDSGATNHCVSAESQLKSQVKIIDETIEVADGRSVTVNKSGTAVIEAKTGNVCVKSAIHLPGLKSNLLSVSKATDTGHCVVFKGQGASVIKPTGPIIIPGPVIVTARKERGLYIVNERNNNNAALSVQNKNNNNTVLWHRRWGHINYGSLYRMANQNYVKGMEGIDKRPESDCVICLKNKICEEPYPSAAVNSVNGILDRVHSDICGPFRTKSLCGALYFATFIDEHSRFCKVYALKSRADIGSAFKNFKTFVEKQTGRAVRCIRTDNAKEYVGGQFAEIVRECGIKHETSVARCPQQNGIAERKNRTLVEMARCLIDEAQLPEQLWAEAIQTANYLRNRSETRAVKGVSPFEKFWGIKPSVGHLRVFGCEVVSLNKEPNRNKLKPKGKVCRFIGYSSSQKGYRILDENNRIFISRNVRFVDEAPFDERESEEVVVDVSPATSIQPGSVEAPEGGEQSQGERYPLRSRIKAAAEAKAKEEQQIKRAEPSDEETDEDQNAPVLKADESTVVKEPETFEEARSGPFRKWW